MFLTRLVFTAGLAGLALAAPAAARAETYHTCKNFIDALPAVIGTQGTWCLRGDLTTAMDGGVAISIVTNNVTIDCNGYKLGGLAAGNGTGTIGVHAVNRLNATVRNCTIRGFQRGVRLAGVGGGHLVENNRFDGNRLEAIEVHGDGGMVRGNMLFDTGESTVATTAIGIQTLDTVDVRDNTIDGVTVRADAVDGDAYGIYAENNTRGAIVGNRIGRVSGTGTGGGHGIWGSSSGWLTIADNILVGDNLTGSVGVRCTNGSALAKDNVVTNFPTPVTNCTQAGTLP